MSVNFEIIRPGPKDIVRKDWTVADTLVDPLGTAPLLDGEWVQVDANNHAVRYTDDAAHVSGATKIGIVPSWPVWAERGRYDVQAIKKVPTLYLNAFEAETLIFDATGLFAGAALEVANITYPVGGTVLRRGLVLRTTGLIVGYVTRLYTSPAKLRFIRTLS